MVAWQAAAERSRNQSVSALLVSCTMKIYLSIYLADSGCYSSCEYMDGCEWREEKAKEATRKYEERRGIQILGQ